MYKFITLIEQQDSENHLTEKDNLDFFSKGVFNPNNISISSIPAELKTIGNEKLENMKKGEKLHLTEISRKTFIIEKQ